MRLGRSVRLLPHYISLPKRSLWRWTVSLLGLSVLGAALVGAADPYRQTQEFREVVTCERGTGDCFGRETGSVVGRRTYTTTSTTTYSDGNGQTHTSTTTTTHYEVTWKRADDSRQTRDVSPSFYAKAKEGQPATLRLWREEVVGVEVIGEVQWFLPKSGAILNGWLYLAVFGLGVLLWGLLFGWWDGFFMLAFRLFCWMFMSFLPVSLVTDALAYDLSTGGELVVEIAFALLFVGIAGGMLFASLDD